MRGTYLELVFDLAKFVRENRCLLLAGVDFFLQDLSPSLEHLDEARLTHVTDIVAFVLHDDALGADVDLLVLTKELGALVGVLEAVLLRGHGFLLGLLFFGLRSHVPCRVQEVQDGEVLY